MIDPFVISVQAPVRIAEIRK